MGAPVTRERCVEVLKTGHQRQRILAAHYLSLLEPGTPLFNTSAPALRQQRRLAKMS
jgi:intergrase/recombinase